jgi:hypothetical protein
MKAKNSLGNTDTNWEEYFNVFLSQAHVLSILSPLYSCGLGHKTARHIIIHCFNYSAASHALGDTQDCLLDYNHLVMTPTSLSKVNKWVMERGMLSLYQRAGGFCYSP